MQRSNEDVRRAYRKILAVVDVNVASGEVVWSNRPRSDFASQGSYITWNKRNVGKKVGYKNGTRGGDGLSFMGFNLTVARIVALYRWGEESLNWNVKFKNGNPLDLSYDNLSLSAASTGSKRNRYKPTGVVGVYGRNDRFYAAKTVNGKQRYLGSYATIEEATAAFNAYEGVPSE